MSDAHISKLTACLSGKAKTAALKYCELYKCATVKELYRAVQYSKRPAGVSAKTKERLLVVVCSELLLESIIGGKWAEQHANAVVNSLPEREAQE